MIISISEFGHLQSAMALMAWAHKGQVRKKDGGPYELHPRRVHAMGAALGYPLHVQIGLLWHDVMEDGPEEVRTTNGLRDVACERFRIPDPLARDAINLVSVLTNVPGQSKEAYIDSLAMHGSQWPILMKVLDRIDNLREGQASMSPKWLKKYLKSTDRILGVAMRHSAEIGGRPEVQWLLERYEGAEALFREDQTISD